ncbi:MAG: Sec-independent protein translocase subunit TatB [Sulfurimonas sp.]|nr:Sec-independent protein translocase subunit TatB [Sulfurimonas sp.]
MFGMGFTEILIIAVIAILFLGPDKLPSAMVDIAKFFRQAKKTIGTVKESLEQEMNVSEIKQEALAYKKELLDAKEKLSEVTDTSKISANLTSLADDMVGDIDMEPTEEKPQVKEEKVTFKKKKKNNDNDKEENIDV